MKYKLLENDTMRRYGRTLFRIEALKNFGKIKKGDLGGYIESENNLSHEGIGWVFNEGIVFADGEISGGVISGGEISGGVIRGGVISGGVIYDGEIRGGVIRGHILQIQGSKNFVNISQPNHIQIGCIEKSFEDWKSNFLSIGAKNDYSDEQIKEYAAYIDCAINFPNQPLPIKDHEQQK